MRILVIEHNSHHYVRKILRFALNPLDVTGGVIHEEEDVVVLSES